MTEIMALLRRLRVSVSIFTVPAFPVISGCSPRKYDEIDSALIVL